MPDDARERAAADRPGIVQPAAALQLSAAGGHGSSGLGHATDGPRADAWDPPWLADPLLRGVIDATALLAGLLLAFCGMVLAARRLAGAMTTTPGPAAILAAFTAAAALLLIADRGSRCGSGPMAGRLARFGLLATVAAVALPLRIASPAAMIPAVVALVLASLIVGLAPAASALRLLGRRTASSQPTPPLPTAVADGTTSEAPSPAWDAGVQQRFERRTLVDGTECIRGRVRVTVATGSRLGVAHVGFCPPLATTPSVEATTDYDGVEAVVSAAEVLPWGVRIECRLDEAAEEGIEIPVDLVATAPT